VNLPNEYRFDVPQARKSLAALAAQEPEARIALTLAQLGEDGLEAESDVYLPVESAAALLATVTDDQCLQSGNRLILILRVTRLEPMLAGPEGA